MEQLLHIVTTVKMKLCGVNLLKSVTRTIKSNLVFSICNRNTENSLFVTQLEIVNE